MRADHCARSYSKSCLSGNNSSSGSSHGGSGWQPAWAAGLAAYEEVRPLSAAERSQLPAFLHSGLVVGGMNWLRWLCVEGRQFSDPAQVLARMEAIAAGQRRLLSAGDVGQFTDRRGPCPDDE